MKYKLDIEFHPYAKIIAEDTKCRLCPHEFKKDDVVLCFENYVKCSSRNVVVLPVTVNDDYTLDIGNGYHKIRRSKLKYGSNTNTAHITSKDGSTK